VIVVADDLGADPGKNRAVFLALSDGTVDAASALANGDALEEAAATVTPFADRVGAHLVLTEGEPLTPSMRALRRFCDGDGRFRLWRGSERAFRLDREERDAVRAEWRAQIERLRGLGFRVGHLDSHHHVHTEPGLAWIAIELAGELGVERVRLARNWGPGLGPLNRAWKELLNRRLRHAGLAGTRWFGRAEDYVHEATRRQDPENFELMVHPVLSASGTVEDEEAPGIPLAELVEGLTRAAGRPQ
jgi:predicted glycoside hydrolase/deacetylase ChbG (UPF0249 family)